MKNLLLILIALPLIGFGQGWEQTFGGIYDDYGVSIKQTTDGGYIIIGSTSPVPTPGYNDIYLIKIDENGEEQWSQTFGGQENDYGHSVQQTTDGGYIITGVISDENSGDGWNIWLIKTDENGEEQWSQTFGGQENDSGYSVQQTTDGGYIITGFSTSFGSNNIYLIKTDENGEEQWSQTAYGEEWFAEYGTSFLSPGLEAAQQTLDGGYIIAGQFSYNDEYYASGYNIEAFLIKTDENGEEQWSQLFGGDATDVFNSVQQTTDGGYIICGGTWSFGNGGQDCYLIKTDENGEEQWSQTFGGQENDSGHSVQQTTDGGYIITGNTSSFGNGEQDCYLIKTDGNGEEEWSQTFGGQEIDSGYSGLQTIDGGYIICGGTRSFGNGGQDCYLIKTDSEGNIHSTNIIETLNIDKKLITTIDILGRETNNKGFQLHIYDDGSIEKKYVIK